MGATKNNAVHMEDGAVQVKKRSQFQETWRRLKRTEWPCSDWQWSFS